MTVVVLTMTKAPFVDNKKQERYVLDAIFDVDSDAQFVHMG